jgi:hypothetical protein
MEAKATSRSVSSIKETESLRTTLIYKNERVMSFEKFFTGFEVLTNAQKINLLFQKVQSPSLQLAKSAPKVQEGLDIAGAAVTYNFIAKSLSAEAASLPDYVPHRNASGVISKDSAPESGVKGADVRSTLVITTIGKIFQRTTRTQSWKNATLGTYFQEENYSRKVPGECDQDQKENPGQVYQEGRFSTDEVQEPQEKKQA